MLSAWLEVKQKTVAPMQERQKAAALQDAGAFTCDPRLLDASWNDDERE